MNAMVIIEKVQFRIFSARKNRLAHERQAQKTRSTSASYMMKRERLLIGQRNKDPFPPSLGST